MALDLWDIVHADHRNIQRVCSVSFKGPLMDEERERKRFLGGIVVKRIRELSQKVESSIEGAV